jgi:plastocyanin
MTPQEQTESTLELPFHLTKVTLGVHIMKLSLAIPMMFLMLPGANPSWAEAPSGSLVGRIVFSGPPGSDQIVEITRDASFCGKTSTTRAIAVNRETGGVEEAIVRVDTIAPTATEATLPPVIVANRHCAFSPRIAVGQVGQQLEIRNDDPIMHNTHLTLENRTFMNVALVPAGRPVTKLLTKHGIYRVRCDAHKFMTATVMALPHPFFSVTDGTGAFRISHLPPGDHVVTVWHQTLGTLQHRITIPIRGEINISIKYPANAGTQHQ